MTEPIGYAALQIIPSLDGVAESIDKQLGGKLLVAGKQGGKQLAKGVGEGLKDLEREVESAGRAYQKLKDKAADALGKVRADEAALQRLRDTGASSDRIIKAEERLATSRRNSARANRESEDSHKSLLSAQNRLADGTDNLGRRFGGMADLAASAGRVLGGVALAGVAALGTGAVIAGRELYELGAQFDDLADTLQVKTGLSGAALDELQGSVEKLGTTNVPDTFANIGEVAAEVTRNLHLTGQPLEEVTSRLANLQRLGVDVNVRELGKAFRGFGVDVDGQVPALNSLYEATTTSGLSIDDMLASVVKGGPALRALGLSFGESAALVATFEDAGLDADKSIAGLTKGLAGFSKDGKAGSDALRDAVTQIQNLAQAGDEAGAIDLSNKLFGAKGGVAFFDAIKSGALDLQSLSDSLATTGIDINQVSDDTSDWAEQWQTLKNEVAVALEPVAGSIFDQVGEELGDLSTWVTTHKSEVIDFFIGFGETAISAAEVTTSAFAGVVDFFHLFDTLVMKSLSWLPGYDDEAAQAFNDSLGDLSEKLNSAADSGVWQSLRDNLHEFGDEAKMTVQEVELLDTQMRVLPDGKTITITDNTPEVAAALDKINLQINPLPDGSFAVVPKTAEGQAVLDRFIEANNNRPVSPIVRPDLTQANTDMQNFADKWRTVIGGITPPGAGAPGGAPQNPLTAPLGPPPQRATGGMVDPSGRISGPGSGTSDSILAAVMGGSGGFIRVSNEESINTAASTRANWPVIDAMNAGANIGAWFKSLPTFAGGGLVDDGPDVSVAEQMAGTPYSKESRFDCSGSVARVINGALGMDGDLMTTKTAREWLAARGFVEGSGGPGQIRVGWYDRGPGQNDGHMAMTLSDGRNAESGGANGVFTIGGNAAGADDPQFDHQMYLPTVYGEGAAGSSYGSPLSYGASIGAGTPGVGPDGQAGTYTVDAEKVRTAEGKVAEADARVREAEAKQRELEADAKESDRIRAQNDVDKSKADADKARRELDEARRGDFTANTSGAAGGGGPMINMPSAFPGLASIGLDGLGLTTKASPNSPERTFEFGNAAGAAVSGQVQSVLDVFGVEGSPGWLQGLSQFVSGISISDSGGNPIFGGGGVAPLSASPMGGGTVPPDTTVHGTGAGQAPGPVYNITARDTEDAFVRAWRLEREKSATKLARY